MGHAQGHPAGQEDPWRESLSSPRLPDPRHTLASSPSPQWTPIFKPKFSALSSVGSQHFAIEVDARNDSFFHCHLQLLLKCFISLLFVQNKQNVTKKDTENSNLVLRFVFSGLIRNSLY